MKKKTEPKIDAPPAPPVPPPPAPVKRDEPNPLPAVTSDMVWGVLAALAGAKAAVVATQAVLKDKEKAYAVTIYPPDSAQKDLIEKFGAQAAMNERTHIYEALRVEFPDLANKIADVLGKRGAMSFTMSIRYECKDNNWSMVNPGWSEFTLAK